MNNTDTILKEEILQFRELGRKFYNKELSVSEFKSKSGGMGVYAERGGETFMIRLRIHSGVLTFNKINIIMGYLDKYNLERIHLTTRQTIQLHHLKIDEICDIMKDAIDKGLYTRGSGGNFPRNVALSPLSGVDKEEAFDVTDYALLVNDYFMDNILSYKLPRKLKIAFSNNDKDTSIATATDLGFLAVIEKGENYFKLYISGGLGKNPAKGVVYDELIDPKDVLYHVEAITQLFMAEGDYENKSKARTRYIVARMGEQDFLECYKKHLKSVKENMTLKSIDKNRDYYELLEEKLELIEDNCLIKQRQKGLYTVIVHPTNGEMKKTDLKQIVEFLDKLKDIEIRLSMTESMYIRNLTAKEAEQLLELTKYMRQKTKVEQSVSCVGVPTCQMGIEQSQKMLKEILEYLNQKNMTEDLLPAIHISGCTNSCSRHQLAPIGLSGKKKKVQNNIEDVFEISIGGTFGKEYTKFGNRYGDMLTKDIPVFLYEIAIELKNKNIDFENYLKEYKNLFEIIINKFIV